jgi:hypothetical protein
VVVNESHNISQEAKLCIFNAMRMAHIYEYPLLAIQVNSKSWRWLLANETFIMNIINKCIAKIIGQSLSSILMNPKYCYVVAFLKSCII